MQKNPIRRPIKIMRKRCFRLIAKKHNGMAKVMDSITAHTDDNGVMHIGLIEFLTDEKYTDF